MANRKLRPLFVEIRIAALAGNCELAAQLAARGELIVVGTDTEVEAAWADVDALCASGPNPSHKR